MGGTHYSASTTTDYLRGHRSAGTSPFVHTAAVASGVAKAEVHDLLDPKKKNKAGQVIRESRDSDAHPTSRAVAVIFDETGSMSGNPPIFVERLPKLMAALVKKGFLEHPQILFGAFGDANCRESAPVQIGQFESGNEMDSALTNILLEGGGGGSSEESSELAIYFMARHTSTDCFEKRGDKGYLFIVSDEKPYAFVKSHQVKDLIGDSIQADILLSKKDPRAKHLDAKEGDILEELMERFEVFWIMPGGSNHWGDDNVESVLKALFGQRFIKMENAQDIVETISGLVGLNEGFDINDVKDVLKDVGADAAAIDRTTTALTPYIGKTVGKAVTAKGKLPTPYGKDEVARV